MQYIVFLVPWQCERAIDKHWGGFADFLKLFSSNKSWDEKVQKDLINAAVLDMLLQTLQVMKGQTQQGLQSQSCALGMRMGKTDDRFQWRSFGSGISFSRLSAQCLMPILSRTA